MMDDPSFPHGVGYVVLIEFLGSFSIIRPLWMPYRFSWKTAEPEASDGLERYDDFLT